MSLHELSVDPGIDPAVTVGVRAPWAKRALDLAIGIPLCAVAVPVILLLAAVLSTQLGAGVFFVHDRIGQDGNLVRLRKLRTLSPHTDPYLDKTGGTLVPASRFASFLRASHLDELPQLFSVPFGRLSLVGPRPRMLIEAQQHGDLGYDFLRTTVPQGCTGLWQISEGTGERVSDHPEYDLFYITQHTIRLDAWILWRTCRQAILGGSITLADVPRWTLRNPSLAPAGATS